jgi:hypothetical protein
MNNLWDTVEAEPWDIEIDHAIKGGCDPHKAHTGVIMYWMWHGDLRPLAWAIRKGHQLHQGVFDMLAVMAMEGRLKVIPGKRGRPKKPEANIRNLIAAMAYEESDGNSGEVFDHIAEAVGMSHQTVRKAVTAHRKRKSAKR